MLYCTIYAIEYLSLLQSLLLIKLLGQFTFGMVQYVIVIYNLQSAVTWNYLGLFSCMLVNYWVFRLVTGIRLWCYYLVGDLCYLCLLATHLCEVFSYCINPDYMVSLSHYIICCSVISMLISVMVLVKTAFRPFTYWLLSAMTAPTPVSAMLHSCTLVLMGLIFIYKVLSSWLHVVSSINYSVLVLYFISVGNSTLHGLLSCNHKSVVALSTVCNLTVLVINCCSVVSSIHVVAHAVNFV